MWEKYVQKRKKKKTNIKKVEDSNTSALLPSSYYSTQSESVTQSDSHGTCEQKTILTETRRITETTMRMEHKSPHPDIEFKESVCPTPSPIPFKMHESENYVETTTKPSPPSTTTIPIFSVSQPKHFHNEQDHLVRTNTFENIKYKTFDGTNNTQTSLPTCENAIQFENVLNANHKTVDESNLLTPGPAPEIGYMPTINDSNLCTNISNGFLMLENDKLSNKQFTTSSNDFLNKNILDEKKIIFSPPNNDYDSNFDKIEQQLTSSKNEKKSSVRDTIQTIANKIKEYETHDSYSEYQLKAPTLVKFINPIVKPYENGYNPNQYQNAINLEPGDPPEICFASRLAGAKKPSTVEIIEKKLEDDLKRGPTKILPVSVRMVPPSPQIDTPENTETTKKYFAKQIEHFERPHIDNYNNIQHKTLNEHIYHHMDTKQKPIFTPTNAYEKVRFNNCFYV